MNKIEFLADVARMDKTQGNYSSTKLDRFWARREKMLWDADDRFIALYEYLRNEGFDVYVFEILRRRTKNRKSIGRMMRQFAHIWLPQLNLVIRFSPVKKGERDIRLKNFILTTRRNFFTCVVNVDDDAVKKIRMSIPFIKVYKKETPRLGAMNDVVRPKKRDRIRKSVVEKV